MGQFKSLKQIFVSRSRSPVFELVRDFYVINIWFKFEEKIQNTSKVFVFTRNHTDDDNDADDDKTNNNVSPPDRGETLP